VSDIEQYLAEVANREGVKAEPEALNVIAQKADGAMRDALSIFDQVVSFCGNTITYKDTIANLNVLDYDYYFKLVDCFQRGDITNTLLIFNEILQKGFNSNHFISGLTQHFRDLLICKDPLTVQLLEVGGEIKEQYKKQAGSCPINFLVGALQLASDCDIQFKSSSNQRFLVELTLVRITQLEEMLKKKLLTTPSPQ
jgi:DNA polymerase-3 subunit gamma/tau